MADSAQDLVNGVYGVMQQAWSAGGAGSQAFLASTGLQTPVVDTSKKQKHGNHE